MEKNEKVGNIFAALIVAGMIGFVGWAVQQDPTQVKIMECCYGLNGEELNKSG